MTKPCGACGNVNEFTALRCARCGFKFTSEDRSSSPDVLKIRGRAMMNIFGGLGIAGGCLVVGMFLSLLFSFLSPGDHFRVFASLGGTGILIAIYGVFRIAGTMASHGARLVTGILGLLVIGGGYIAFVLHAPFH